MDYTLPQRDPSPAIFLDRIVVQPYDPDFQYLLLAARQLIMRRCYAWRINNDFKFRLPQSAFDEKRNRPLIEFVNHGDIEEELGVRPLSEEQLATIRQDGTFIVSSSRYPVPYKWQLTTWLYKGKERTYQSLLSNIGTCFSIWYYTGEFVAGKQFLSMRERGFHSIYYFWKLLRLFVGLRSTFESEQVSSEYLIEVERHYRLFKTVWRHMERDLFEYLRVSQDMRPEQKMQQEERMRQIFQLSQNFKLGWQNFLVRQTEGLLRQFNATEIKEVLRKQCEQLYHRITRINNREVPTRILECLERLLIDIRTIEECKQKYDLKLIEQSKAAKKYFQENYPIQSHSKTWWKRHVDEEVKLIMEANKESMLAQLGRRVRSTAFPLYLEHISHYEMRIAEIKALVTYDKPTRTFQLSFPLCPPYVVEYTEYQAYRLIKTKEIEVDTGSELWRIKLYCIRYYTWLRNILYYTYRNMIVGPFGLQVLLRCHDFYPEQIINSTTGQVGRDPQSKRTPIAASVKETALSVGRARQEFENAPDTGFFGKVCGRVFNVIYVFFFVSVLYMIGYLLIVKPILIMLNIVVSLFILATAFLWTPALLFVHYLFTLLIYNCDYEEDSNNERQREVTQRCFPLALSTIKFVIDVALFLVSFLLIFLTPITSFLLLVLSLLRYIFRQLYDNIMYMFIRCCGRSPTRETCVAWKISGHGVARNFFFNLKEQDVYILVTAQLERIQLEIFQKRVTQELDKPQNILQGLLGQAAQRLNLSVQPGYLSSVPFYKEKLQQQINERMRVLPQRPGNSIRFIQEELNLYLLNSKSIVLGSIRKNPSLNYFQHLNLREGDLEELVVQVWIRIFGDDSVFEPLQKIDQRLEIVGNRQVDEVSRIMTRIHSDVQLITKNQLGSQRFIYRADRKSDFTSRHIALDEHSYALDIGRVLKIVAAHRNDSLPSSKDNEQYSVVSNANIPQLFEKYQKYLRGDDSGMF